MREHLSHHWWKYLLSFAVLGTLVAVIVRSITPDTVPLPVSTTKFATTNLDGSSSQFDNITYTGGQPEIPNALPIAQLSQAALSPEQQVKPFIDRFGLTPHSQVTESWISDSFALSKRYNSAGYELFNLQLSPTEKQGMQTDKAIEAAQSFLENTLKIASVSAQTPEYLRHVETDEPTTNANAEAARIPFTYTINSLPVFYGKEYQNPYEVFVSADYQIIKVIFQPIFPNYTIIDQAPTISVRQAVQQINNNVGSLVYVSANPGGELSLASFRSGELKSASVEYRIDDNSHLMYPFYKFTGILVNDQGVNVGVEVITPAVRIRTR